MLDYREYFRRPVSTDSELPRDRKGDTPLAWEVPLGNVATVSEVIVHSVGHLGAASSTGASPGGEVGRSGLALGIVLDGS